MKYVGQLHHIIILRIYENSLFFFTTDYNTRKFRNLKDNKNIALAVDVYNSSTKNKAVIIQGTADIIERGKEFKKLYQKFEKKFEWVRNNPWKEGEAPFIKVKPTNKVSWGLEEDQLLFSTIQIYVEMPSLDHQSRTII